MEVVFFRKIKTITIKALFSDDVLMDRLVLKGGNALDIVYDIGQRASIDLDFSIAGEFEENELELIERKIRNTLIITFKEYNFEVFDIRFKERPKKKRAGLKKYWGGYKVEFKIIELDKSNSFRDDIESRRRNSIVIGPMNKRVFTIDISKFEYYGEKDKTELDGLTIFVYTPQLIVMEKLRAICQQMPEYCEIIGANTASPRSKDFFDIYTTLEHFQIDLTTDENKSLLKSVFLAKEVPLLLLGKVGDFKDYHRIDFDSVINTVNPEIKLKTFDFYFDYVVRLCNKLESLWVV